MIAGAMLMASMKWCERYTQRRSSPSARSSARLAMEDGSCALDLGRQIVVCGLWSGISDFTSFNGGDGR